MKLVVFSYKICWADASSPTGYATDGGFPFQMRALSELFDHTRLILTVSPGRPSGLTSLTGHRLEVDPLPTPTGSDFRRKLSMLFWLPRHLPRLWREVRAADAVHAPVPGDIGTIGLALALVQRKPLFVRHCGTWGEPVTLADRLLLRCLERVAGGANVVMATGGLDAPPSQRNRQVRWIFSTSLPAAELDDVPTARPWRAGEPLALVTVGRLTAGKNTAAAVRALALVRERHPRATLDIVGHGDARASLQTLAAELGVAEAVTFHGNVSHERVLEILSGSQLFVFPTRVKEGFPKALLEAMACGLPVVATAVSVIPQLVGDRCGVLLKDTGADSVTAAILRLTEEPDRLAEMARHAREASRAYTLERWAELIGQRLEAGWGRRLRQPHAS